MKSLILKHALNYSATKSWYIIQLYNRTSHLPNLTACGDPSWPEDGRAFNATVFILKHSRMHFLQPAANFGAHGGLTILQFLAAM